jgi:hypothetical protein
MTLVPGPQVNEGNERNVVTEVSLGGVRDTSE